MLVKTKTIYAKHCTKGSSSGHYAGCAWSSFGDIGYSPLYALRQCFLTAHLAISEASVLGILSLIFWCMMLTISFKYVTIIMRADNNGEGGIMSLLALNLRTTRISDQKKIFLIALGFIGASLFLVTELLLRQSPCSQPSKA